MIGERLRNLREDADMNQEQLGKILNISKHSISAYERNISEPPDDIKLKMARIFSVSIDYLLGATNKLQPIEDKSRYLRVPMEFSQKEIDEIIKYIEFLLYKHKIKAKTTKNI